jgi:predicted dehydrogenase
VYPGFLKRIEICGTKGSMVLEEETLKTWEFAETAPGDEEIRKKHGAGADSGGGASDPAAISFQGHRRQFEEFLTALEEGRPPLVDGLEAKKSVEIIQAIYTSAKNGKAVQLP